MHTEGEAKKLWCPQVTLASVIAFAVDKITDGTADQSAPTKCIASGCAMWRWHELREVTVGQHPHDWPDMKTFHSADTTRRFIRFGYCGLAGRPEIS